MLTSPSLKHQRLTRPIRANFQSTRLLISSSNIVGIRLTVSLLEVTVKLRQSSRRERESVIAPKQATSQHRAKAHICPDSPGLLQPSSGNQRLQGMLCGSCLNRSWPNGMNISIHPGLQIILRAYWAIFWR